MKKIVAFGAGGFAREVHQLILDINEKNEMYDFLGFLDENVENHNKQVHRLPVLGGIEWLDNNQDVSVIIGIGNPSAKKKVAEKLKARKISTPTIIHPNAIIGINVRVGEGSIVCAGCILTTDISIGNFVTLNLDCTIGHDAVIRENATLAPGVHVSGSVIVNQGVDLGTASSIIQNIQVGEWSIVGAGAVVSRDLPANVTAVGIPAKVIKERESGWHL
jgi:sugar O-acyltransferase (sialic acid O-acetyltransferase NeuD family)